MGLSPVFPWIGDDIRDDRADIGDDVHMSPGIVLATAGDSDQYFPGSGTMSGMTRMTSGTTCMCHQG